MPAFLEKSIVIITLAPLIYKIGLKASSSKRKHQGTLCSSRGNQESWAVENFLQETGGWISSQEHKNSRSYSSKFTDLDE